MGLLDDVRPAVDSLLLADFVHLKRRDRVVEFGSGNGAVLFRLAHRFPGMYGIGIEREAALVAQAYEVARKYGFVQAHFVTGDYRQPPLELKSIQAVVANPPYRVPGTGKISPYRGSARHEIHGSLGDLIASAERLLAPKGKLFVVHLAERAVDLLEAMRRSGIEPKRAAWCHHGPGAPASLLIVEGRQGARPGLKVDAPIFIRDYQTEMAVDSQG